MKNNRTIFSTLILIIGMILITGCITQTQIGNESIVKTQPITPTTGMTTMTTTSQGSIPCQTSNSTPFIAINPISNHNVGDFFEITGTTNLDVNSTIGIGIIEPRLLDSSPLATLDPNYHYTDSYGNITIRKGECDINLWSYPVNLSKFHDGKTYRVNVILLSTEEVNSHSFFRVNFLPSNITNDPIIGNWRYDTDKKNHTGMNLKISFMPDGTYSRSTEYCQITNGIGSCMGLVPMQGTWRKESEGKYNLTYDGLTQLWDYSSLLGTIFNENDKTFIYYRGN